MSLSDLNHRPPKFSVVIPVYGCCGCLDELCRQLMLTLDSLSAPYEVILVDDRSPDGAWDAIGRLQSKYSFIRGVLLSRNFGQHIAITAGLAESRGEYTIVMDCDLQDPPDLIKALYAKSQEGFDIVMARRIERHHSPFRLQAASIYFRMLSFLTGQTIDGQFGTFSLLTRKVVESFLRFNEPSRHFLFILRYLGFQVGEISYVHSQRSSGTSSYSLTKLVQHAIDGILFQSTRFLTWIIAGGLLTGVSGILLAIYFVIHYFTVGALGGWTSTAVLILICSGAVLCSVGITGVYIGKIFDQTKQRPLFIIDEILETRPEMSLDESASVTNGLHVTQDNGAQREQS